MSEHADQFDERDSDPETEPPADEELASEQEGKGYGEDEGEREQALENE